MLNDFQEDLRKLYVKVRRSEVEDCFIKIASIEGQLLSVFLSKGHKNLPLQSSALDSIKFLDNLKRKYGEVSVSNFVEESVGKPEVKLWPTLLVLNAFKTKYQSLLEPYSQILDVASKGNFPLENTAAIDSDLSLLTKELNTYIVSHHQDPKKGSAAHAHKKKNTLKEKRLSLFAYLMREFTMEYKGAYDSLGEIKKGEALMTGALADPTKIGSVVGNEYNIRSYIPLAQETLKKALRLDVENHEEIYNQVRNSIFYGCGSMTKEDISKNQVDNNEAQNFAQFLEDKPLEKAKVVRHDVDPGMTVLPTNVLATSVFLYILYQKTK